MSWDYGRLVAEVYELDKPVGSTFPALRYYTRQLAGVTGRILEPATGTGASWFRCSRRVSRSRAWTSRRTCWPSAVSTAGTAVWILCCARPT